MSSIHCSIVQCQKKIPATEAFHICNVFACFAVRSKFTNLHHICNNDTAQDSEAPQAYQSDGQIEASRNFNGHHQIFISFLNKCRQVYMRFKCHTNWYENKQKLKKGKTIVHIIVFPTVHRKLYKLVNSIGRSNQTIN